MKWSKEKERVYRAAMRLYRATDFKRNEAADFKIRLHFCGACAAASKRGKS